MGFVEDLENSIDIVDLIGRYTKLKKAGANYKALCPFPGHSEKTPSFVVSPAKQIAYCFGCHKWGGPIKFISDMENCEFREALQILGNITGQEIRWFTENKEKLEIKKNLYSLYKDAASHYKSNLEKHPEVKKYLIDRWLSQDDITAFWFWYAASGIELYNYLKEKWYEDELIEQSHIFLNIRSRKDKFIARLIFPIQNLRGDVVAFAGRILGKGEPKYLNSPASDIYDKSSILYGLFKARNTITKVDHVIITEWYMDTIALHKADFMQSVAVSGTALTEKHITILKRLTHKIYLCFDNDKAGEQATRNSLEILKNKWLEVKIIVLRGEQKDPDEYIQAGWDFQACIDTALTPIAYYIEKNNYNLSSIDEKKKFIAEVLDIIRNYSDSIEQDFYIKELAEKSNTPVDILYDLFKKTRKVRPEQTDNVERKKIGPEEILLAYIFHDKNISLESIKEKILFPEWLSAHFSRFFSENSPNASSLPLEQKELYKALYFSEDEAHSSEKDKTSALEKIIDKINRDSYKKLLQTLKEKINSWDHQALEEYSKILALAKKYNIK